jgi:hypothetical protein
MTVIKMQIHNELTQEEKDCLGQLFADALKEFADKRRNLTAYMDKRYPDTGKDGAYPLGPKREKKTRQVEMRVGLAMTLRNSVSRLGIEEAD